MDSPCGPDNQKFGRQKFFVRLPMNICFSHFDASYNFSILANQ